MSIDNTSNRVNYVVSEGVTSVTIPFRFFSEDDIRVIHTFNGVETELTLDTHFRVEGTDVVFDGFTPTANAQVTVLREIDLTQPYNWVNNDRFDAETLTNAADRIVMMIQQLEDKFRRAVVQPESTLTTELEFPVPDEGKYLAWQDGRLTNVTPPRSAALPRDDQTTTDPDADPNDPDPDDGYVPFYLGDGSVFVTGDGSTFEVAEE